MVFVDPDGDNPLLIAAAISALISAGQYTANVAFSDGGFKNWSWGQFGKSVVSGAVSGAVSYGIGSAFGPVGSLNNEFARAFAHGYTSGLVSNAFGGDFKSAFYAGGFGSFAGSATSAYISNPWAVVGASALSGGIGSEIGGGNFWEGAATGGIIAGFNHLEHLLSDEEGDDGGKRIKGKGNTLRGGPQSQRDHDMKKYPKEFNDWYHKNTKDYKLGGQPDPNLDEPYQDWLDLGKPRAISGTYYNWNSIRNRASTVTGLTGAGLTIYLIISEGSRLFPPRNLIPIP